jgi:hypothetical protein
VLVVMPRFCVAEIEEHTILKEIILIFGLKNTYLRMNLYTVYVKEIIY